MKLMRMTKEENTGSTTEQNSEEWEFGAEREMADGGS